MALKVVSISGMQISRSPSDVLVTYSLGSCIGVAAFDPQLRIGGLIHCLLPHANVAPEKAAENPCMFVSTGVVLLIKKLLYLGASRQRLIIKAAGGATMMQANKLFDVGARNAAALQKLLEVNSLSLSSSDFGGSVPRTMYLYMDSGRITVKSLRVEQEI